MWFILKGHYSLSTCYSLASVPISLINCQFGGCAVDAALGNTTSRLAARIIASVPRPETTVLIGSRGCHSFPAPLPFVFVVTSWAQKYIEELSWLKPDGLDLWSFFLLGYKLVPRSSHVLLSLAWDGFNFAVLSKSHRKSVISMLLCGGYVFMSLAERKPCPGKTLSLKTTSHMERRVVSLFQWDFWLFLRSESLRPDAGGSVQVSASVEVDTVPALLCSLPKPQHREQPAHRRDQAPRFTNPDRSVSPKWSQSKCRPTQGHFRQETCMTAYKVLSCVRGILTLSWELCFCRHRLCQNLYQNWYNVKH